MTRKPEILAPAGDTQSFLAAMAAGADAVYLGLKHFFRPYAGGQCASLFAPLPPSLV
mgnify:CR=1 FL=1